MRTRRAALLIPPSPTLAFLRCVANSNHCHTSEKSPVTPIIATDPKTPSCKSLVCHTYDPLPLPAWRMSGATCPTYSDWEGGENHTAYRPPNLHAPTGSPCIYTVRSPPRQKKYRSEEHTSELQSRFDLVCRLLLEKKKKKKQKQTIKKKKQIEPDRTEQIKNITKIPNKNKESSNNNKKTHTANK